jgi:YD repeat-containing protein
VRFVNGAGEVTTITYDEAGQAVARELPDDTKETYEYNERGELVRATNAAGQFQFRRDALGRIVREAQKVGDEEHWIETAYDQAGNQVRRATSLGHTEAVQRDVMGARTRTLLGREHSIEHANDILAREVNRKLPGGGTVESGFDPMGRLIQRLVRSPFGARAVGPDEPEWMGRRDDGVNISTSYQYGADGELVAKQDRARGATRYEYDPVGQLLAAIPEKARAEVFRYDPAGNVHTATGDDPERVYAEGNRLVRNGDTEYEWDADGRLSRKTKRTPEGERVWTYAWNGAGLLETVGTPDGRVVQFGYDPFARRVEKQVREREGLAWRVIQRSRFVWDQNSLAHEIRRRDEERDPVIDEKTFVFDDDGFVPLAHGDRVKGATGDAAWFHYVNDASGAPDRLIDEDGAIACELTRKVWGEGHAEPGARTETAIRL